MPTHVFKPLNDPPTWWDRVLVHPYENAVSTCSIVFGLLLLTQIVIPSSSLDRLPWWVSVLVGITVAGGGVVALIGLHWKVEDDTDLTQGWALDRLGHYLQAGALAAFTTSVAWFYPGAVASWLIAGTLTTASILRVIAVRRIEAASRRIVTEFKRETNGSTGD